MSVTRFFSAALLLTLGLVPYWSDNDYDQLLANLEKQTFDYVQEKVYLHLDKPYYALGDDLWFKAYAVAGPNHTPTPLSHNLYVELVNPKSEVLARHNIFLDKGMGQGDFQLADSLASGTYTLRAYTNWMRNFDEAFFFTRQVELIGIGALPTDGLKAPPAARLQFFPEGGDLIANIPTYVAFEVNREEAQGQVLDSKGQQVTTFKTDHKGMGKFSLTPVAGEQYTARLDGETKTFALPMVKAQGLALSVDAQRDDEHIWVSVKTAAVGEQHEAFLVCHVRGIVNFGSKLQWKGAMARVKIPKANVSAGVVHLTLFDKGWEPVAERLVYQHAPDDMIKLELLKDKEVYEAREEAVVKLRLTDKEGQPMKGAFSLSATDTRQIDVALLKEDIRTSLLLTSDVSGTVDNPLMYFNPANANSDKALDLMMMTKGWRRFNWRDLLANKFPETEHEVEQGFNVTGRVTQGLKSNKSVGNAKVKQIGMFNGVPVFAETKTGGNGRFEMKNLYYYEADGMVRATGKRDRGNVTVRLDTRALSLADGTINLPDRPLGWNQETAAAFLKKTAERKAISRAYGEDTSVTDLGTVIVESNEGQKLFQDRKRGMTFNRGQFGFSATERMARGQHFINPLYMLQGQIPGVIVQPTLNGEPQVIMSRETYSILNSNPEVIFYIDDAQVDISAITALPSERVERVEVLKGNQAMALLGDFAAGGAIFYYTKTAEDWDRYYKLLQENGVDGDRSTIMLPEGYYRSREYYKPVYTEENRNQPKPDFRDLIHWEPMIFTDENGEAEVRFFNADLSTTIHIRVEGIWEGGIPLVATGEYQVEK